MNVALDRDALYYPYIHIRDANWLKATLLSFPQVRRIVPSDFTLNDPPQVRPFRDIKGARGEPLLGDEPAYLDSAHRAQERLLKKLKQAAPEQLERFTFVRTVAAFPGNPNAFQMHAGKMQPLLDFLEKKSMAWPARQIDARNPGEWYALHPELGEVVMSLIAMSIAAEKQLDIVTSSGRVHHALARMDEAALVGQLFGDVPPGHGAPASASDMADELCQVVMLTAFDLSKLTGQDIAELQKDGKDLRSFKTEILKIAATIPDIADPVEREKRLKQAAGEVLSQWGRYRKSLPRFAIDALLSASAWKPPELLTAALAGASSSVMLASGAGLLIGLGVYAGLGAWRGYKEKTASPYQYLTKIQGSGALMAPAPVATA
jgi:hypothetical protein